MLALPLRFARTLLTRGLRRKLLVFPRIAATILTAALGAALLIALAALSAPVWRLLAAVSLALLVAEAWRGRAWFGRTRRLPPGSLALAPLGPWIDPDFYVEQVERHGPVFKMSHLVSPQVCIVDLEKGRDFLRRHHAALAVPPLPFDRFVPGGFVRYMEPEPHRARSATLRAAISRDVVAAGEPVVRSLMREALAGLARLNGEQHPRACLDAAVLRGASHLFFGFAPGSETLARFERAMQAIDYRRAMRVPPFRVRRALEEAMALLGGAPPGGFLGALAAADPAAARDPAVLVNMLYVLNTAAWSDVAGLMAWITKWLAFHPEWLTRLRAAEDPSGMAERIVRETLRLSQSEYLVRRTREPLELDGFLIPRGWLVRVCIREIHRRADVFPEPTRFLPDRFLSPPGPMAYAPFGASQISCLGEEMTLSFGRLLVTELAAYEIAVADDGPPELGPFHWQPSGRFRVRLTPLTARPQPGLDT